MLKAAAIAAGAFGLWYWLVKPRQPAKSWQMIRITGASGVPRFVGPYQVTEERGLEWEMDLREEHWGSEVVRLRCDTGKCRPV